MIQNFNVFNVYEIPEVSLCYPNRKKICDLSRVYNLSPTLKFNSLSEISFEIVNMADGVATPYYDLVKQKNKIHIDGLGWFIIQGPKEESDGIAKRKTVLAYSEECFLNNKNVSLLDGTYRFYSTNPSDVTIMSKIMGYMVGWSIGTISSSLWNKYRTFSVTTATVYSFIRKNVQDAYECFFVFDTDNKTVYVYDAIDVLKSTNIVLSFENLTKNVSVEEKADEFVTALAVTGGGNLDIRPVNPLGGIYIYDFSYAISQHSMSTELEAAVIAWEASVATRQPVYAVKLSEYKTVNAAYIVLTSDMTDLQTQKTSVENLMQIAIDAGDDAQIPILNAQLTAINASITSKQAEMDVNRANSLSLYNELQQIVTELAILNNFSDELYEELSEYIVESAYQNENIIQSSSMTAVQAQDQAQELYNQGVAVLTEISQPRYEFSLDATNFVFLKEYESFTEQMELGSTMRVELDDDTHFSPALLQIKYNFHNPSDFSLTFGNRLRLDDSLYSYADLIQNAITAGNSVNVNSSLWNDWSKNYETDVSSFISGSLDTSRNELINSEDAEITINSSGLKARKKLGDGTYDLRQLWLTPRTLAFTRDGWDTVSTAIGRVTLPDASEVYGVVGDVIVGSIIASETLEVKNQNNKFVVDGNGATLEDATLTITTSNDSGRIVMSPEDGFRIQKNVSGTYTDQISLDLFGNATFNGTVIATGGQIGGFNISATSIKSTATDSSGSIISLNADGSCRIGSLNIIKSGDTYSAEFSGKLSGITDGTIGGWIISSSGITAPGAVGDKILSNGSGKLGLLTYDTTSATFAGNIYAKNINTGVNEGYISGSQIGSQAVGSRNLYKGDYGTQSSVNSISADLATLNAIMVGNAYATTIQTGQLYVKGFAGSGTYYPAAWRTVSTPTGTISALTHV